MILLGALAAPGALSGKSLKEKAEVEILNVVNDISLSSYSDFPIPVDLRKTIEKKVKQLFLRESVGVWRLEKNGESRGIAILDHAMGKTQPFSFIVIFDPSGSVRSVRVVKYREQYGGGIQGKGFLRQFEDKNRDSTFVLGKDIDGVSGSTISSHSITRGVEKLAHLALSILERDLEK
jgi:Na+-translocating ferredoxin:NAD+ oxidoreductase RnfG subunit